MPGLGMPPGAGAGSAGGRGAAGVPPAHSHSPAATTSTRPSTSASVSQLCVPALAWMPRTFSQVSAATARAAHSVAPCAPSGSTALM
jgi:hypothetical protein